MSLPVVHAVPCLSWTGACASFTAVTAALLLSSPVALAGTVSTDTRLLSHGRSEELVQFVRYEAASGEQNRLLVTLGADFATVADSAGVLPSAGCSAVDATTARCPLVATEELRSLEHAAEITLGDGDDTAELAGTGPNQSSSDNSFDGGAGRDELRSEPQAYLFGGRGDDRLFGGASSDGLEGGAGADLVDGGAGADRIYEGRAPSGGDTLQGGADFDSVSYDRRASVRADLSGDRDDGEPGERDRIGADIEALVGGRGGDRLTGNAQVNSLRGGRGNDRLDGRGGRDELDGGRGKDRIPAFDGRTDVVSCGPGRDLALLDGTDLFRFSDRSCELIERRSIPRAVMEDLRILVSEGRAALRVACPSDAASCIGSVSILDRGEEAGRARFDVAPGDGDNVPLPLRQETVERVRAGPTPVTVVTSTRLPGIAPLRARVRAQLVTDPFGASVAAGSRRRRPCPPPRTRALDAGVHGQVYVPARSSQRDGEQDPARLCSYRTRHHRLLGYDDCFNALEPGITRFAGRLLGVQYSECTPGGTFALIRVLRVRDGSRVRSLDPAPGVTYLPGGSPLTSVDVTDLVMRPDGALAWIVAVANPMSGPSGYQVRSSSSGTDSSLLDEGDDIEPGSLALAGSRVYWTQGGEPRSALIP